MKNAVVYARYSSERQTEQSIDGQLRVCKEFADKNNYRIINTYIDRAMTGKNDNREDFQRMLKDSAKCTFDFVIVYKLDRFSRNRYDSAVNKAALKRNGVKVLSACEQITDAPEGIILESMLEGIAEYYSAELSQKVKRGLKESRIKGNFTGGYLIYGYGVVDKKWTINETEANLVRKIFKDYHSGMRLKDIMDKLNKSNIKTKTGGKFTANGLSRLLRNEKYTGVVNADEQYTNIVPQIIEKDIFDEVNAKLDLNKRRAGAAKANIQYLLSGKLYCGSCGTLMTGESGTSHTNARYNYYKCFRRKKTKDCDMQSVKKDDIENIVADKIQKHIFKPNIMKVLSEKLAEVYNKEIKDHSVLESLIKQKGDNEKAIKNLLKALELGIFTSSTKQRLEELETGKENIECEMLLQAIFQAKPLQAEQVYNYIKSFAKLDLNIQKNKERLLEMFVRKVVLNKDKTGKIYCNISKNKDIETKENAESEIGFGFDAFGGESGI